MKESGVDIVDLSGYVVDFPYGPTKSPPDYVIRAVTKALESGWSRPELRGLLTLRKTIAEIEKRDIGIEVDPKSEVLITSGGLMQGLYNVMQAIINPGDEVIVFCPGLTYDDQIRLAEGVPVFVKLKEENGFKYDAEDVERIINKKTKMMIVTTPHNPTGHVADESELEELADIAIKHDLLVLSDEILWKWVYDDRKHISIASFPEMQDRTIIGSSVTKIGMFDWRIGWIIANEELINQIEKIMFWQNEFSPPILQVGAEAHLTKLDQWIPDIVKEQERKRDLMWSELNKIQGVSCFKPEGHLTAFPNISSLERSSIRFASHLLHYGHLLVSPGIAYLGEGHLRIGFHRSAEEIKEGIKRLQQAIEAFARARQYQSTENKTLGEKSKH